MAHECAAEGAHDAVASILETLEDKGRLLDAPCGAGALTQRALELGFDPLGVDIERHSELTLGDDRLTLLDLNQPLPFDDGSFRQAISVEGIEHLDNPRAFVRELSRVLQPGGDLIISTPNVLNLKSRWRFLTRGYHRHFTPQDDGRLSSDHLFSVDYVLLKRFLSESGLDVIAVSTNRRLRGLRERLLAGWVRQSTKGRHAFAEEVLTEDLLFGQILIVHAKKRTTER